MSYNISNYEYGHGTYMTRSYPFGLNQGGRALCSDGKYRRLHWVAEFADTFFSTPAGVVVYENGQRYSVSGYVTVETMAGWSTETEGDLATLKFIVVGYGKNSALLPKGSYRSGPRAAPFERSTTSEASPS